MSQFENVTVLRKANVFFGGGVTSRSILFADGSRKTLGLMQPGEYSFTVDAAERMEIQDGVLQVQLPGSPDWQPMTAGSVFDVPAGGTFTVRVEQLTDYCCSFLP